MILDKPLQVGFKLVNYADEEKNFLIKPAQILGITELSSVFEVIQHPDLRTNFQGSKSFTQWKNIYYEGY